jgi:transcription termination factor Rho
MPMNLADLKTKSTDDLSNLARTLGIPNPEGMKRQDLVLAILRDEARRGPIHGSGLLEVLPDGFGFLRAPDANYTPGADDIYVSPSQIRRFQLRTGDAVSGVVRPPKESERYYALLKVETINGLAPEERHKKLFDNLVAIYPDEILRLEFDRAEPMTRLIDLLAPIGKGGRALILAPPRAGKTAILRSVAASLAANHPGLELQVLLVGERPEEITDMVRSAAGEVVASSFDEPPSRHVQVADLVLEKAKRTAESGGDAVILLDSMSRLARAYAANGEGGNGATDAGALHSCKRFFAAARKLDEGGSLTIIATALDDRGSPLDAAIADELGDAANTVIRLDRDLVERRVYPGLSIEGSGTVREDKLLASDELEKRAALRAALRSLDPVAAIEKLRDELARHPSNRELLDASRGPG